MNLSVVIPVRDDSGRLVRLLRSLDTALSASRVCLTEIIVVDDGSSVPMQHSVRHEALPASIPLVWRRHAVCLGAGSARNTGLDSATGSHVLFLDADDTVTPALGTLLDALDEMDFDFVLFAHDDTRRLARGQRGPAEAIDRALWVDIAMAETPGLLDAEQLATICRISNYPWNKVWRHDFLRAHAIRCGEIPVHNDIEPHWAGFIEAERVLCSTHACVIHHVLSGGDQLTHRGGKERLCVFDALEAVRLRLHGAMLRAPSRAAMAGPFLDFTFRLLDWVETLLPEPDLRRALHAAGAGFLRDLAQQSGPVLASAIEQSLAEEPGLAERFLVWSGADKAGTP